MIVIKKFKDLVNEVLAMSYAERLVIANRGTTEIEDGTGDLMLMELNVHPQSADHLARITHDLVPNHPAPEALCYTICALCAVPPMTLRLPQKVLLKGLRQGFVRAMVRTEMGWNK